MFAPSLWQFKTVAPDSFVWSRGLGFASQCVDPFQRDIEPALQWRLLPPLVAHALGLRGWGIFILSWVGVVALLGYVITAALARLPRRIDALFLGILVGTTAAVFTPTAWIGLNDGWLWLAVLAAAFGRSRVVWVVACLLGPWIDERFIVGFPLIVVVRWLDRDERPSVRAALSAIVWVALYVVIRVSLTRLGWRDGSSGFLATQLRSAWTWIPLAPLGWWMGLRAGWLAVGCALLAGVRRGKGPGVLLVIAVASVTLLSTLLAADLSRSISILLPAVLLGSFAIAKFWPTHATQLLGGLCAVNLFLPAAHVVYTQVRPISPLLVELWRFFR